MDWYAWLSKTGLDPSLVYDYALTFTNNELEEGDMAYFSHELLQSMGVSIAKHRLEIVKLARKEKGRSVHPVQWLKFAIKKTRNYIAKRIRIPFHRESSSLIPVRTTRHNSLRWKLSMLQRNKKFMEASRNWQITRYDSPAMEIDSNMLMLTNGSPLCSTRSSSSNDESRVKMECGNVSGDTVPNALNSSTSSSTAKVHSQDEYWSSSTEEIKWDSMFQNLKPT